MKVRVMVVVVMKVGRRRRRSGRICSGARMAKGKLEEIPNLRFGVRFGFSYGHVEEKRRLSRKWKNETEFEESSET